MAFFIVWASLFVLACTQPYPDSLWLFGAWAISPIAWDWIAGDR